MIKNHNYFVYILASRKNGTLYAGVTNDLIRRAQEHREGLVPGFTKKYAVTMLVYYEAHTDINEAIAREKRIKRWLRNWKIKLIEDQNPNWQDLWPKLSANTLCTGMAAVGMGPGDVIERQVLLGGDTAPRNPATNHEHVRLAGPFTMAVLAGVAIVLLIAAVKLDELRIILI